MSKTRETMSWRNRTAALIATAALGGAMAFGAVAAPAPAWADTTVTIQPAKNNSVDSYTAYRLFTADIVTEGGTDLAHTVAWDGAVDQNTVVSKLNEFGYSEWLNGKGLTGSDDAAKAQNAFEFINEKIKDSDSQGSVDGKKVVTAESFAMQFALWIQQNNIGAKTTANVTGSGDQAVATLTVDQEGYYLILSTATKAGEESVATAPIWVPLGGSISSIKEKASVPTVDKTITEGGADENGGSAQVGDEVSFKITATLPENYGAYDTFKMVLTDTPTNLEIVQDSAVIKSGNKELAQDGTNVKVEYGSNGTFLTVTINDLKTADKDATKDTVVTVEYKAKLTEGAVTTPEGNKNDVKYDFSNNPGSDGMGSTTDEPAYVYTYQLDLVKEDKGSETALAGAEFIIKNNASGKYFNQTSGEWDIDDAENAKRNPLITKDDGSIEVKGLAEGAYTLTEVKAPEGYETPAGDAANVKLTVAPEYGSDGKQTGLTVKAEGALVKDSSADSSTGHLSVTAVNDKNIALAMTGAEGVGIAGAGVLAIGLAWYLVRNHRKSGDQA